MAITKNLVNIGDANISNTLTAETLKKRNGTDKQILLADGTTKDMGTGTTTFLRNDGTWATPPIGTDEKVKVNTSTTNARFPLLAVATSSNVTNGGAYQAIYDAGIVINPYKHSVAEGYLTSIASGFYSHAEGDSATASGTSSHAEGCNTNASGTASHAEGWWTTASGTASHSEGAYTKAIGGYSHAEGYLTFALGEQSHAEGKGLYGVLGSVTAIGSSSTVFSLSTLSTTIAQQYFTLEIMDIIKCGSNYAKVTAITYNSNQITTDKNLGVKIGDSIYLVKGVSYGLSAHSEGCLTSAIEIYAHAEGEKTIASGTASHAEGGYTKAIGEYSHAEGSYATASGDHSHAEGYYTIASGDYSHAGGYDTIANVQQVTVIGRCNSTCSNGDLFVIGNGTDDNTRKTVFKVSDSTSTTSGGGNAIVTVTGRVNANEGFFQTSDERQKNIISDLSLEKVYDLIDKCQTIIYTLKDDQENKEQIGMIAQEIQKFFPELISEDKDGMLSLDYSRLTVIIFKVLKDLIKRINKIEQKLN